MWAHSLGNAIAAGVLSYLAVMFATPASAGEADLQLWFSTNSDVHSFPSPANPVLPAGFSGDVYLYARSVGEFATVNTTYLDGNGNTQPWTYTGWLGDVWERMSIDSYTTAGLTFSGSIENPSANGIPRWGPGSDFTWSTADQCFVDAPPGYRGLGGAAPPTPGNPGVGTYDDQQVWLASYLYSRVGSITIASAPAGAQLFLKVGTGHIYRRGGDPTNDRVFFGVGDAGLPGTSQGAVSTVADLTVAPEPTALALLGLGMMVLRRR